LYYPTQSKTGVAQPYLGPITASVFESAWNFTAGTLGNVTSSVQWRAPYLNTTLPYPTILFGPGGGGPPSIAYTTLLSELASQGYTVAAVDHPYEQPFLQYPSANGSGPYGGPQIYGLPVVYSFNTSFFNQLYDMRVRDFSAFIDYFPSLAAELRAPFNTKHFGIFGHSLGGASALGALLQHPRNKVLGSVNLDGLLTGDPAGNDTAKADAKKPVMLLGQEIHTPANEGTWGAFPRAQTGWWREILVNGSMHLDFSDATIWKELGRNDAPDVGSIDGSRMVSITRAFVTAFFDKLSGEREAVLQGPSRKWSEANFVGSYDGNKTCACI